MLNSAINQYRLLVSPKKSRRGAATGRGWSAPPAINQLAFFSCEILPSINTGYWSVPQRVGEELQQAGDDQHLLQSISWHFLLIKSCHQSIQVSPTESRRGGAAGRGWSAPPAINQFAFSICEILPSINTGYWSFPQRVGEKQQQAGDDQHLLQSISLHFQDIKSFRQSIQVIGQSQIE
jgi:hypothetical protein